MELADGLLMPAFAANLCPGGPDNQWPTGEISEILRTVGALGLRRTFRPAKLAVMPVALTDYREDVAA